MIEIFIAFPVGAIVGWIIREIISDRLARDRAIEAIRITEFNKSSAIFRSAFIDVIYRLRKNAETGDVFLHDIINDAVFINQEKAKILFEPYIITESLGSFNDAWEKYKNAQYEYAINIGMTFNPARISDKKGLSAHCLVSIENLLSYAKPKF